MNQHRLGRQDGMTLVEVAIASAIFLFVALVAYTALNESTNVYRRGDENAEMQQRTRLAFDQMMGEIRLAGFDYNRDGVENAYPDQPDEQIEYLGEHAIAFRGNLDFGDASTGREEDYEADPADPDYGSVCCPVVTTGNDEIVVYALRSDDATKNTGEIRLLVDLSIPRDGGWDVAGEPANEEDVTIEDVDLTGDNPPYTLMRFAFDETGAVTERPVASDIRNLTFSVLGADGLDVYCMNPATDGTCPTGEEVAYTTLGGMDDIVAGDMMRRTARAAARRIDVELVGMTENDVRHYDDGDTAIPGRPKFTLEAAVVPQNLGMRGRPDLEDASASAPENVTVCGGQCNTLRIEWDEVPGAAGYNVALYTVGASEAFFTGTTPGVAVPDTDPVRVFAIFQRIDSATIVTGARISAKVQSRFPGDEASDWSVASAVVQLSDVVRPSAPIDMRATGFDTADPGWPDVSMNLVPPDTLGASTNGALENRIVVSWTPPFWALNVTDPASPADSWTTAAGAGDAPLTCDTQGADLDNDGVDDAQLTRLREMFGPVRYLVFRSTNPRFVPTNADLIGSIQGEVDVTAGRVAFTDRTRHVFTNGVFNRTESLLANCTTYYYRVRAVDDCWDSSDPASLTDPHLSPFSPPLNPDPTAADSDDVSMLSSADVGPAIPGYAIPKAQPRKPAGLRFNSFDRRTDDGDGLDATIAFEAVKLDNTMTPTSQPAYEDIAITQYQVYSHATNPSFTLYDIKNQVNGVRLDKTIHLADVGAGRISRDDENDDGTITAAEDEAAPWYGDPSDRQPQSGLRVDFTDMTSRYYKVVAIQCRNEDTVPDDDPVAFDYGIPSDAVKFPCDFGGGPYSTIAIDSSNFPSSVTSDATLESPLVTATRARLVVKDRATGDRAVTPMPGKTPSSLGSLLYRATFTSADIAQLTDNFGNGNYAVSVEWDDSNGCMGVSDSDSQVITPPTCCLQALTPVMLRVATTDIQNRVQLSCDAQAIRLQRITVSVDNLNGNQQERFDYVYWDDPDSVDDRSFPANRTSHVFDLTANPPVLGQGQTGTLRMIFSRSAVGDNVTVTYDYKIGGAPGQCTFTARIN